MINIRNIDSIKIARGEDRIPTIIGINIRITHIIYLYNQTYINQIYWFFLSQKNLR